MLDKIRNITFVSALFFIISIGFYEIYILLFSHSLLGLAWYRPIRYVHSAPYAYMSCMVLALFISLFFLPFSEWNKKKINYYWILFFFLWCVLTSLFGGVLWSDHDKYFGDIPVLLKPTFLEKIKDVIPHALMVTPVLILTAIPFNIGWYLTIRYLLKRVVEFSKHNYTEQKK